MRPAPDLIGLDDGSRHGRGRVGVRHPHRAPGRASDGGRARERHRDGAHGRRGDGHHGNGLRRHRRVAAPASRSSPTARHASGFTCQTGEAIHAVSVDVTLEASLSIPMPPLTQLTHHPERVEQPSPGPCTSIARGTATPTARRSTATCDDGTTTEHVATATAYAYVPRRHHRQGGDGGPSSCTRSTSRPRWWSESPISRTREESAEPGVRRRGRRPLRGIGPAGV